MELKQYFKIIQKKWWLIAAIVVVAVLGTGVKSIFFTTPVYAANAKIIVNQSDAGDGQNINVSTLQTSILFINSYKEIIKSEAIMNKVVERYPDLGASAGQISSNIAVTSASNSQVMNLTYQDTSYERAATVVNAVATVFKEEIPQIMNVDNITILTQANPQAPVGPINLNPVMNILIAFVASLMLAIGLVFLLDYLDDTLKTENDLAELINVPVLAVVGKITKEELKASRKAIASQKTQVGESQYATINQ
ncbi:YveK family protein [Paenibacillus thailandensis]|uniref:YveK family protein n=1 Tax=Paenibacillus thailandensis TaxID=393250 RepID=A0ABW5R305_9BACL